MAKRAGIYVRISQDADGQRAGVKRQREDCMALAERKGWTVTDVYEDNDQSAWRGKARPGYTRMLDDIKQGHINALVVWHLDRLHRHPKELEEFFEVCDAAGLTALASVTGDIDLSADDGRFMTRILGAVARKESDDKSRRIQRKAEELAKEGKVGGGGYRPFGFEGDRKTVRKDEAKLIKEAAKRILSGESLRSVAADWNDRGIKTVTGKDWSQQVLRRIMTSGRIAGLREHKGEIVGEAEWEPIIDDVTHNRLRTRLLDPARRTTKTNARKYLLTGIAVCGNCGAKLVARPREDGARRYACVSGPGFGGCNTIFRMAEPVEDLVTEAVFEALDTPELTKQLHAQADSRSEEAELLDAIREEEAKLEELATDHYDKRLITKAEYLSVRDGIQGRIDNLRRELAKLDQGTVLAHLPSGGKALRQRWEERGLDWRRAVVSTVVDSVKVHPAVKGNNRFDPTKVEIVWRA